MSTQHGQHAGQRPAGLAADDRIRRVIALLRHHGRGGKDHRQPDHDQQQGGEEHPFVDPYALCHALPTSAVR